MLVIHEMKTHHVDIYGHQLDVRGTWEEKPFHVRLFIEFDGRDLDHEPLSTGPDIMADSFVLSDFFCELCCEERFSELSEEAYAQYEKIPRT